MLRIEMNKGGRSGERQRTKRFGALVRCFHHLRVLHHNRSSLHGRFPQRTLRSSSRRLPHWSMRSFQFNCLSMIYFEIVVSWAGPRSGGRRVFHRSHVFPRRIRQWRPSEQRHRFDPHQSQTQSRHSIRLPRTAAVRPHCHVHLPAGYQLFHIWMGFLWSTRSR